MWRHRFFLPTFAVAENKNDCKGGDSSVHVNDGATGEVKRPSLEQPTVRAEHPVRNDGVHNNTPHANQHCIRRELQTICRRTGNQCRCDDCKHHLECEEHHDRHNKSEVAGVARQFTN